MNIRLSLIVGSALAAWTSQAWTWSNRPDDTDRSALIEKVAKQIQSGDELAYLPGWEQRWALQLGQRFPYHQQRLGQIDILRPFHRLWLFESADARTVSWLQSKNVKVLQEIKSKGMKARLLQHQGGVQPMAYPSVKGCQLSAKRKSCSSSSGRLQTTELGFEGRFAWGQKISVKSESMTLILQSTPGASLVGGLGWTGHGLRHSKGPASVQLRGAQTLTRTLSDQAGLDAFELQSDAQGKVEMTITLSGWTDGELGLSSGWAQ